MNGAKCDTNKSAGPPVREPSNTRQPPTPVPSASLSQKSLAGGGQQAAHAASHIKCCPAPAPQRAVRMQEGRLLLRSIQYETLPGPSASDDQLGLKLEIRTLDNEHELQRFMVAARRRRRPAQTDEGQLDEFQVEVSKWSEAATPDGPASLQRTGRTSFRARLKSTSRRGGAAPSSQVASEVALYLSPSKSLSERGRRPNAAGACTSELRLKFCHFGVESERAAPNQRPADSCTQQPSVRRLAASDERATRLLVAESPRRRLKARREQELAEGCERTGAKRRARPSCCCCCCLCGCCGRAPSSLGAEKASSLAAAICLAHFYSASRAARGSELVRSSTSSTSAMSTQGLSNSCSCSSSLASEPTAGTASQPTWSAHSDRPPPAAPRPRLPSSPSKKQSASRRPSTGDEEQSTSCCSSAATLNNPHSAAGSGGCGSSCSSCSCSLASWGASAAAPGRRSCPRRSRRRRPPINRGAQFRSKSGEPARQLPSRFNYSPAADCISISGSARSSPGSSSSPEGGNPNALAVGLHRKHSRQLRASARSRRPAEQAGEYAKRARQDGDKSMTTTRAHHTAESPDAIGRPGASWPTAPTSAAHSQVQSRESDRPIAGRQPPSESPRSLCPASEPADSSNIQPPARQLESTPKTSEAGQLPLAPLKRAEPASRLPAAGGKRQPVADRPSQLDPKNLLSPLDFVFGRAAGSHEQRAHSFTGASLSQDSSSLVAQLAASARSRSLCTENDRQQLDARRLQQRRLDAAVRRVGDFGRRMSRMTRKAIDRLKVMSSSNPNLAGGLGAGADCGQQLLRPGAFRRGGRSNSQRVKGPAGKRAGNYELELLVPGEAAQRVKKRAPAGLFGRRWGSQAMRDHKSGSTLSLRMSQDEQLLFAPGGVYMGTGERCNLLELAHTGSGRLAAETARRPVGSSRTNSISWLRRPLMRSSGAHALPGASSQADSVERPAESECLGETAPQASRPPSRRPDCASVPVPANLDNDQLRWNNNEPRGQLVVIRVGAPGEAGQRPQQEGRRDAVAAGAGAGAGHRVGLQIMKCDHQNQSDASGTNSSATRHCLAGQKGDAAALSTSGPASATLPTSAGKQEGQQWAQEGRPTLASSKTTSDVCVSPARPAANRSSATNLNRKQSLSAEFDLAPTSGRGSAFELEHPANMSQTSGAAGSTNSTPASKRWLLNFTHRAANAADKSAAGKPQAMCRKPRERAAKIRSASPPAHFSEENRSNSLTSCQLHESERRLLAQLSRSSCAVDLCVAELAEQTSLYLAQLNERFSSSTHRLTFTPPSASQQPQAQQHSTLWFRRSSSKLPPDGAAQADGEPHRAEATPANSGPERTQGHAGLGGESAPGCKQAGSPLASQLYGANLQTSCVHCKLIAELSNHPESAYLSQLLATHAAGAPHPSREERTPVPAAVQVESAPGGGGGEQDRRQGMRGPSLVLTACSNQGTSDEDEASSSREQSRRQSAGSTAILINFDGASTSDTTADSSSPGASRRSSASSMGPLASCMAAEVGFQPLVSAPDSKPLGPDSDSDQQDEEAPSNNSASTSAHSDSEGAAKSSSVGGQQAAPVVFEQAATHTEEAPLAAAMSSRAGNSTSSRSSSSTSSKSSDSSSSAHSLSSSSNADSVTDSDSGSGLDSGPDLESERASRSRDEPKVGRRKRKKKKKRSLGLANMRDGQTGEAARKMNTLEVPAGAASNSKQMRSNSLDTHYLLKTGAGRECALSLASSESQSRELIDSDYEDYALDEDYSKASSSKRGASMALAGATGQPAQGEPGLLCVQVNKSRSRSVDISLPTQPGESYGVRDTDTPSGRSALQQQQLQLQAAELEEAKVAEKKSTRAKRFIQGEIKVPYANEETRALKLFVDWDENCANGEHLWLYQGSSSEACYVGESECLKHGPRLSCSACKITAHTGCIGILTNKIKFICKHTFKDLTINNPRHLKELHQNVIYHHWVHKRAHCGRCKQCTKTIGNTKLPFSSKEIQAITCSWCKVSYHNKENCYTLSTLTEPCNLGAHRESIIPPSWIVKLPAQSTASSDADERNQLADICDLNQRQQQQSSKLIELSPCQTLHDQASEHNNNDPQENLEPLRTRQQQQQQQSLGVGQQRYGSSATLITDTSGYMSADGCNSNALHTSLAQNNCEILMDPSALHATDLSLINQAQGQRLNEQVLLEPQHEQLACAEQTNMRQDCDMMCSSYSLFEPSQPAQQMMRPGQVQANIFKSFKIIPQPIPGIPNAGSKPVLVFVNPRSGGNQGAKMMQKFNWLLNPRQVFDLIQSCGPRAALELYRDVPNLRILTIGGDGTASWILSHLDDIGASNRIPVAVLPLGTGNDLARALGWGGGYADEPIAKILAQVRDGEVVQLDRWNLHVERNLEVTPPSPNEFSTTSSGANMDFSLSQSITSSPSINYGATSNTNTISSTISMLDQATNCDTNLTGMNAIPNSVLDEAGNDRLPMDVINNYFSFGVDAHIALEFHTAREAHPERFNSRLRNKMFYGQVGGKDLLKRKWKDLSNFVTLYCDGQDMTSRLKELKVHSVLFLNIPSYGGGTRPWPTTATAFAKPRTDDGLIEVIGLTTYQLPLLQAGGHGTCIAQCRNAKIITSRTIPMQVDGEPCKLLPSIITISFKNRVCMLSKSKSSGYPQKLNQ